MADAKRVAEIRVRLKKRSREPTFGDAARIRVEDEDWMLAQIRTLKAWKKRYQLRTGVTIKAAWDRIDTLKTRLALAKAVVDAVKTKWLVDHGDREACKNMDPDQANTNLGDKVAAYDAHVAAESKPADAKVS